MGTEHKKHKAEHKKHIAQSRNQLLGATPLLPEEGWTRHKADAAKPPLKERTGWSLTSHISECVLNTACERPPRLRRFGGFAISSYWRSHPSSGRRGVSRPKTVS